MGTFDDNRRAHAARTGGFRQVPFRLDPPTADLGLRRRVERFPFVPADPARLAQDCYEAYNIQVAGLQQRLNAIGGPKVVIGVAGGLDSTHALIVAARAMDRAGRPRSDILAFTMPGFATREHTKDNALAGLLAPLLAGNDVGLLSEAGCPAVADPGANLVALAQREGIRVVPLIGPSSLLLALMASGLNGQRFAFHGYLPAKDGER